ncbi:MAG: hypothetical protein EBR82_07205 [Caulobacteraceae bacterium]|nr:hypothetical protein [Caulobacteraceae bacterium]
MPESILASQEPLEALHRMGQVLVTLRDDVAHCRTSEAVIEQKLISIESHLGTLNGRTAKNEDRIAVLETALAEVRGAWRFVALVSTIPAGIIGAVASWIVQHGGGK